MEKSYVIYKGRKIFVKKGCLELPDRDIKDISEIKSLENLVDLELLDLSENSISEIKNLDNLVNLRRLEL
jgi:hypothetical protein